MSKFHKESQTLNPEGKTAKLEWVNKMNGFQKKKHKWPITIFKVLYITGHREITETAIRRAMTNSDTNGEAMGKK